MREIAEQPIVARHVANPGDTTQQQRVQKRLVVREVGVDISDMHMRVDQAGDHVALAQIQNARAFRNPSAAARIDRLDMVAIDDDSRVGLRRLAGTIDDVGVGQ